MQTALPFDSITYSAELGEQAKREGMDTSALSRSTVLEMARGVAQWIAERDGTVHADKVQRELLSMGIASSELGNAAGSIFRRDFVWTGEFVKPERVCAHRNLLRVWRLKDKSQ